MADPRHEESLATSLACRGPESPGVGTFDHLWPGPGSHVTRTRAETRVFRRAGPRPARVPNFNRPEPLRNSSDLCPANVDGWVGEWVVRWVS